MLIRDRMSIELSGRAGIASNLSTPIRDDLHVTGPDEASERPTRHHYPSHAKDRIRHHGKPGRAFTCTCPRFR